MVPAGLVLRGVRSVLVGVHISRRLQGGGQGGGQVLLLLLLFQGGGGGQVQIQLRPGAGRGTQVALPRHPLLGRGRRAANVGPDGGI